MRSGTPQEDVLALELAGAAEPESPVDLERLNAALHELARRHERQARIVELRFFAGLSIPEVAGLLEVSERTVEGDWRYARAYLARELESEDEEARGPR